MGTSGLQTSQNALNTVAHNLTNVDTEGYTRQQVEQSDKFYITNSKTASAISYQQTGLGVSYSNVKQIRDVFLDQTYRRESGRSMFYQVSAETLTEVEDLLGEMNGEAFQSQLSDLWVAIQELAKDPCSTVTQSTLVQEANEFLTRAKSVYNGLASYQDNINLQIKQQVEKINKLGNDILTLNDQIRSIELAGVEKANDLKDQRNNILDQLAELVDISYGEDLYGNVYIQIEGEDFVKGSTCYNIGLNLDSATGFYTPFWPQNADTTEGSDDFSNGKGTLVAVDGQISAVVVRNGVNVELNKTFIIDNALVFNLDREISSDLGTDIGGLKAMLLARGDHRANYTDMYEENYNKVSSSVLMNIEAEFDQMIHNITSAINDVLADAAGRQTVKIGVDTDGNDITVRAIEVDDDGYLRDDNGLPLQLFTKIAGEAYTKESLTVYNEDGTTTTGDYWVYYEEDQKEVPSLYSLLNTQINQELLQTPSKLNFRLADGSEDNDTMDKLKNVFMEEKYTLNPNVLKKVSALDYYDDLVSQVANSAFVYDEIHRNQENTVESALSARDQITAVSSDEELSNMIKFQNAYNASSRFINVVDEMLEHLLTSLA